MRKTRKIPQLAKVSIQTQISILIGTPEWIGVLRPRVTCILRPEHQMAVAAANLLLSRVKDPEAQPAQQLFESTLLNGDSVRAIAC